ncbi:MAG: DUF4864 domain-containing protein [Rhizobiales bacterium]|nr:DUF4864 domain-containing protein [Hyphomicrobiales bacterium]
MKSIAGFLLALLLIALGGPAARADDLSDGDRDAIRSIVMGQMTAFQHDDGNAAYGYASPAIRELFPSPDIFMNMVRKGYPPVYRPQSVTFGEIGDSPRGPQQKVFLTGPDGKSYVAVYTLQRQPDGTWKINGCTLVEDTGASI